MSDNPESPRRRPHSDRIGDWSLLELRGEIEHVVNNILFKNQVVPSDEINRRIETSGLQLSKESIQRWRYFFQHTIGIDAYQPNEQDQILMRKLTRLADEDAIKRVDWVSEQIRSEQRGASRGKWAREWIATLGSLGIGGLIALAVTYIVQHFK